jgi:hypothetical protein
MQSNAFARRSLRNRCHLRMAGEAAGWLSCANVSRRRSPPPAVVDRTANAPLAPSETPLAFVLVIEREEHLAHVAPRGGQAVGNHLPAEG